MILSRFVGEGLFIGLLGIIIIIVVDKISFPIESDFFLKKHLKENRRIYRLEIILFIPIFIIGAIFYLFKDVIELREQISLYIAFFYFFSWYLVVIPVEIILKYISKGGFSRLIKKYERKPKVFEYIFFLGIFWATALLTEAYSREITSGLDLLKFLNTFGMAVFTYGIASACGWYHYIERLDGENK